MNAIINIFYLLSISGTNPNYLFLQLCHDYAPIARNFPTEITITSKVFIFLQDNRVFLTLCYSCNTRVSQVNTPLQEITLPQLDCIWTSINTNFGDKFIYFDTTSYQEYGTFTSKNCSTTYAFFKLRKEFCIDMIIAGKYNYSKLVKRGRRLTRGDTLRAGLPVQGGVLDDPFINELLEREEFKRVLYSTAVSYFPFEYVIVTRKQLINNFNALLKPFDGAIWMFSLISFVAFVVVGSVISRCGGSPRDRPSRGLQWIIVDQTMWALSVIFSQSDEAVTNREFLNGNKKLALTIASWYFSTFLLSMAYQSGLFSSLIAVSGPEVPQSLEAVVQQGIPILTTVAGYNGPGKSISLLKDQILQDIQGKQVNETFLKFVQKLDNLTKFVYGRSFAIAFNITHDMSLISTGNTVLHKENVSLKGDMFAILDTEDQIRRLLEGIDLYSNDSLGIIRNHNIPHFLLVGPFYGHRNFIYPIYLTALGQLEQAGIYQQWDVLEEMKNRLRSLVNMEDKANFRTIMTKAVTQVDKTIKFSEADPVSLDSLKTAFTFCGCFVGIGILVLSIEIAISGLMVYGSNAFADSSPTSPAHLPLPVVISRPSTPANPLPHVVIFEFRIL